MPDPVPVALPWPKCVKCRADRVESATSPEQWPPDPVTAYCPQCGHSWAICGARNKAGSRCGKTPMPNGRCSNHGGKATGRPPTHGRRSKFLPIRLQERAEEALADRDLVSMAEDIALTDALIVDRYERLGDDGHAHLWGVALGCLSELDALSVDGSLSMGPDAGAVFDRLSAALTNGQGSAQAEKEIVGFQEHKRKMSDTEIKRQAALNQFVSAKELNAMLALILTIIRETVKDPGERSLVGSKLLGIVRPVLVGNRSI